MNLPGSLTVGGRNISASSEAPLGKIYDGELIRRLANYLKPKWGSVAGAFALLMAGAALQTCGPILTKIAVDSYLVRSSGPQRPPGWLPFDPTQGLLWISGAYLLCLIAASVCEFAQQLLMQYSGQAAVRDLRQELMQHLHRLDMQYFDRHPVGRLVTRVTVDVESLNELLSSGLVSLAGDLLMLTVYAAAMFLLNPELALVVIAVLPLVTVSVLVFRRKSSESYRRIRIALARINAYLAERLNNMTIVQLFNLEKRNFDEFDGINRDHMRAFKSFVIATGWFNPLVEFFGLLAIAVLLSWAGFRTGQNGITAGVMLAFFQYALRFFRPMLELSDRYNVLQSAVASAERIFELLDVQPTIAKGEGLSHQRRSLPDGALRIEFDRVWFAYTGHDWVLRDVSFAIPANRSLALVGHTGAGKSTVVNLLLRFYEVQQGCIRLNGIDIRELDPSELRRRFALVTQDPVLFEGTLRENLTLGEAAISSAKLWEAITLTGMRDFVNSLPGQLDYPIRERGHGFSQGQKQLLSLTRALAHDAPVLILDEATSSVDPESERELQASIQLLLTRCTSLVIAHRLSTIESAHRIAVLHQGEVRELGSHEDLIQQDGIYAKMREAQGQFQTVEVSKSH